VRIVFADSGYWIAMLDPGDDLHERAEAVTAQLGNARIVTSQMALVEFLTFVGIRGERLRQAAVSAVRRLEENADVEILPQSSDQFSSAFDLYSSRLDKNWSITDCASFIIMEQMRITEALAHDQDFEQAGFIALLRSSSASL
jgi:predicted nucleic acid-binding protein